MDRRAAAVLLALFLSPSAFLVAADEEKNGNGKNGDKEKEKKPPKTLFEWLPGEKDDKKEDENEDRIAADRPDFIEASSTVGKGRIQLEAGYTYFHDRENGVTTNAHSYPEALLRVGLFAEWFELRIGQNFSNIRSRGSRPGEAVIIAPGVEPTEARGSTNGAEDLYLGTKLYLVEQKKYFPEMSLIIQTTVPTGASGLSADEMLPGVNLVYGWEVIEDRLTLAGSTQANRAVDGVNHSYVEFSQAFLVGLRFTKKFGSYLEYFGLYPTGAVDPETGPQNFADAGLTYLVTKDFQLDVRAGLGLNRHADDFFAGAGFAYRY